MRRTRLSLSLCFSFLFLALLWVSGYLRAIYSQELPPHEVPSANVAPNSVVARENLIAFVKEHDLKLNWDSNYDIGLVRKDNIIISFKPGLSFVLINFNTQRFVNPVVLERGQLLATEDFLQLLDEVLISQTYKIQDEQESASQNTDSSDTQSTTVIKNPSITKEVPAVPDIEIEQILDGGVPTDNFGRIVTLVIDPGHGGRTPGAVGRFSYEGRRYTIMEKDIVLDVSLQVRDKLRVLYPNLNIVMTREVDEYVSLEGRTELANTYLERLKDGEGMVFVSIHANAALTSSASGYEVWYLPPNYQRSNLVSKDFSHSQIYGIINNLVDGEITLESLRLAQMVIAGLDEKIGLESRKRGIKEEKFYVVRNAKMPAILVELGFITNPEEGHHLTQPSYKEKLSNGIVQGLDSYLKLFKN